MNRRAALLSLLGLPAAATLQRVDTATLKPTDVIIVTVPGRICHEAKKDLVAQLRDVWPDHKVVILSEGMAITMALLADNNPKAAR